MFALPRQWVHLNASLYPQPGSLPTIVNSPRVMAAVVINISARAFPPHVITQAIETVTTARIRFASMAIPLHLNLITEAH
jgi:hypothetical protein